MFLFLFQRGPSLAVLPQHNPNEPIGSIPIPPALVALLARDLDYVELLPMLFELQANNFYIGLASERTE